jgi:hypothetical protein
MPIVTSENAMRRLLDFLIYLLIGAALSLAIVAYAYETDPLPGNQDILRWGGLLLNTLLLFGFVIKQSRPFWHAWAFWVILASMLVLHVLVFCVILQRTQHWNASWFLLMYPVEVPLIVIVLDWGVHVSGARPQQYKQSERPGKNRSTS